MAKSLQSKHKRVIKTTCQGGRTPKTSTMNKGSKLSIKAYRGQGR